MEDDAKRAPFQVLVLPYRRLRSEIEYAVFKRSDAGYWQGIAGGGNLGETPLEAAKRESFEEAGISETAQFYRLETTTSIPTHHFTARRYWPPGTYVIPGYSFCVDATDVRIELSEEHTEFEWVQYEAAKERFHWQSNEVALYELNARLLEGRLPELDE